ncbi:PREDICTED: putative nuclease HARBI1, partial [Trachymyrmex cornetzi]|uniref:putative nuclease HARBI1 n=1 Tax=Trachymyrmex cornetzi TaxID=471704 RepID=UPI00084F4D71
LNNVERNERRPRIIRPRINYMEIFDEIDFRKRFRISKNNFMTVLERIEDEIRHKSDRNNPIPPVIQLLVAIRFYATGSYLITVADFCGISESSAQRIVHRVSPIIAALNNEFIKLPMSAEQIHQNQKEFFQIAKFINVIGCVDCTHIKVESCGGRENELYRNRKGFFSLNIQVVVNARLEIIDIVARWPGSTHDATIFDHSRIKNLFEAGTFGDGLLLADSGYPNLPYVMSPLHYPITPPEHLYNEAQIRTRSIVERFFGIWKERFAVLSIGMRFQTIEKVLPIIMATAVLHNIVQQNIQQDRIDPHAYNNAVAVMQNIDNRNVHDKRRAIVEYFGW